MFSPLSEMLEDGVLLVMDGIVLQANQSLLDIFGYEPQEFIGHKLDDLADGNELALALDRIQEHTEKCSDAVLYRRDGKPLHLTIRVETVPFNGNTATIALIVEKKANARIWETRRNTPEHFRSIFEAAPDMIFVKDRGLRFVEVNPAMERILGLSAEEIIGKKAEEIFGREAGERITGWDLRVLQGDTIEKEHTIIIGAHPVTFLDIRMPLRSGTGKIIGICGISRDITERKRSTLEEPQSAQAYPSRSMNEIMGLATQAAAIDSIILLQGESGSGKDYLARWIHDHSPRASGPFLTINCATVPQDLAESELFGHESGAFTGAKNRKRGLLELAEGGTLLLNEIGELSPALQSKLLVFLDSRSFLRLGGEKSVHVDARILAATHRDLKEEVAEGRFLEALFYRLNVFSIHMPPLRNRIEDIPALAVEIVAKIAKDLNLSHIPNLTNSSINKLQTYHWPGNVRELRNVLERGVILWKGGRLDVSVPSGDSEIDFLPLRLSFPLGRSLKTLLEDAAASICREAVRRSGGNKKAAARLLGISRDSLYRYLKGASTPHNLDPE
jgi:PAS domain S-box-containing protein